MLGKLIQIFKNKKVLLIVFFLVIAVVFAGKNVIFSETKTGETVVVKKGNLRAELVLSGKFDAEEKAILQFQSGGRLGWVGVKEGDEVRKYQAIASLETERLQAALRQARQDFTAAQAEHEKYYDNRDSEAFESFEKKIERTAVDAKQNKAYDAVRIAEENLRYSTIYAPFDGLVTRVDTPNAGVDIYAPTQAQFEIVNPDTIVFSVNADQTEVIDLREGQKGEVMLDSYPDETIHATITNISFSPKQDETGTVYEVQMDIERSNSSNIYRLGMTGDVIFITKEKSNVLFIPIDFIKSDDNGDYVLAGEGKKKTYVKTGLETDMDVEILSGLKEGDVVYD
jgi:HlyD family secretion protein